MQRVWICTLQGPRRGPSDRAPAWLLKQVAVWVVGKALSEDVPIVAAAQRGLQSSGHRGVLGTLEERIEAFQRYVLSGCGEEALGASRTAGTRRAGPFRITASWVEPPASGRG